MENKNTKKIWQIVAVIVPFLAVVVLAVGLYGVSPVCDKLVEMASGNMAHMKCYYMAEAAKLLGIVLLTSAIVYLQKRKSQLLLFTAIGALFLIVPNWFGLCGNTEMACHQTALWVRITGLFAILSGFLTAVADKKN